MNFAQKRADFMHSTSHLAVKDDLLSKWEREALRPAQGALPFSESCILDTARPGFRRQRSARSSASPFRIPALRRRPGRESRWSERELRETDAWAVDALPSALLLELHLSPADRRVLLSLVLLSSGREAFRCYVAQIANMAQVARSTAHLSIRRLEAAGLIARAQNPVSADRNGPNTWSLVDARLLGAAEDLADRKCRAAEKAQEEVEEALETGNFDAPIEIHISSSGCVQKYSPGFSSQFFNRVSRGFKDLKRPTGRH
jgi:hypothetical protein